MNTCSCGTPIDEESAHCPRCAALLVLGLEMDATESAIRSAYRTLVKVWHPDRLQSDPKLAEAAEQKLKDVNSAFEFLTSTSTERGPWRPPSRPSEDAASHRPPAETAASPEQSATGAPTSADVPASSPPMRVWPAIRISLKVAAVAVALLLGRYLWIAFDLPLPASGAAARVYDEGKHDLASSLGAPRERFINAVEQDLRRLGLRKPAPEAAAAPQPAPPAPQKANRRPADGAASARREILPYITVGSTRDEVLAEQGTPTVSSADKLVYGKSELYLKDGVVAGWRIDPASPIRVKFWPSSRVDPSLASFTVGSTKDVVLTVQGTPTAFTEDKFEYGRSEVYFRNNRVVSWKEDPDSTPLWAR